MNRRDFLRLTARGRERVAELSCERLYMRWVDARAASDGADGALAWETWEGEPPLSVAVPSEQALLAELERRLAGAHVLRLIGREWLTGGAFGGEVEARIEAFRRRGGRIE